MFNKKKIKQLQEQLQEQKELTESMVRALEKLSDNNTILSNKVNPSPIKTYTVDAIAFAKELQLSTVISDCRGGSCKSKRKYYRVNKSIIDKVAIND